MSGALGAILGAGTGLDPALGMIPSPDQGLVPARQSRGQEKLVPRDRPRLSQNPGASWSSNGLGTGSQDAKRHWRRAFDRMRWNMEFVAGDQWQLQPGRRRRRRRASDAERIDRDDRYVANIALRHVLQRTAELYPANPIIKAKRRTRIMAANWDGSQQSLSRRSKPWCRRCRPGCPCRPRCSKS
jgi:hypothetical protein